MKSVLREEREFDLEWVKELHWKNTIVKNDSYLSSMKDGTGDISGWKMKSEES